jgi:hypothetical protein
MEQRYFTSDLSFRNRELTVQELYSRRINVGLLSKMVDEHKIKALLIFLRIQE